MRSLQLPVLGSCISVALLAVCPAQGADRSAFVWGAPRDAQPRRPNERDRVSSDEHLDRPRHSIAYAQAEAGYETLSLRTLRSVNLSPTEVAGTSDGAVYGVSAGVRLGFLTLGGRYRNASLSAFALNTFTAELGARIVLNRFEPYFLFGGGYAWATTRGDALSTTPDVSISGMTARAGIGVDYYPDPRVSVGATMMGELLTLTRPGFSAVESPETQAQNHLATCAGEPSLVEQRTCAANLLSDAEGSSFAVGATFSLVMGLHF